MAATCCPTGFVYIDSSGNYNDPLIGWGTLTNSPVAPFYNTCVLLVNIAATHHAYAVASGVDPIECPCCPESYTYSSFAANCIDSKGNNTPTIPCIKCVCTTVTPTPCTTCGPSGVPNVLNFNFFTKACTVCTPDQSIGGPNCKQNGFMPYFINVPNLEGFVYKP